MKQAYFIKSKMRLIYTSPFLYLMMFLQISFLIVYLCAYKITTVSNYFSILEKALFLWIIFIPAMLVQHKVSIYSTYYNCISRIGCKRRMIFVDYVTLAVSTCISACIVLLTPLIFLLIRERTPVGQEMIAELSFLLIRYVLLGLWIQYMIYFIMYTFPKFQNKGGSICVLPFLFYFVFTSPMEFLRIKGKYMPMLDFSAGENYVFVRDGVVLWSSIFFYNIHLVGYLVFWIWLTMVGLSRRWEFLENESVGAL